MTLNEAIEIMKQEFPEKYVTVRVESTWSPYVENVAKTVWLAWANSHWSDDSPNLDEAIASLKRKAGIDQPQSEDVEVL